MACRLPQVAGLRGVSGRRGASGEGREKAPLQAEEALVKTERAGFEPAVRFNPYDGLANRSFRPLRHLSLWLTIAHFLPKCKPLRAEW
jgi:hypothetical protein